jgi:aryl-alcohol dehydrogenase-like predicted oxidoreductase
MRLAVPAAGRPEPASLDLLGPPRRDGNCAHELINLARAHRASPAQVGIAWTLHRGGAHVLAIPGTGNRDHLAENVAAGASLVH